MANPMMDARTYARITGIALAATAVLGIILSLTASGDGRSGLFCSEPTKTTCTGDASENSFLAFDWTHNSLHVILAVVALSVGFAKIPTTYVKYYAIIFGVVYLGLAITGWVQPTALAFLNVHLELGENLVHAVIGLWGVIVGFFGTVAPAGAPTTTPTTGRT